MDTLNTKNDKYSWDTEKNDWGINPDYTPTNTNPQQSLSSWFSGGIDPTTTAGQFVDKLTWGLTGGSKPSWYNQKYNEGKLPQWYNPNTGDRPQTSYQYDKYGNQWMVPAGGQTPYMMSFGNGRPPEGSKPYFPPEEAYYGWAPPQKEATQAPQMSESEWLDNYSSSHGGLVSTSSTSFLGTPYTEYVFGDGTTQRRPTVAGAGGDGTGEIGTGGGGNTGDTVVDPSATTNWWSAMTSGATLTDDQLSQFSGMVRNPQDDFWNGIADQGYTDYVNNNGNDDNFDFNSYFGSIAGDYAGQINSALGWGYSPDNPMTGLNQNPVDPTTGGPTYTPPWPVDNSMSAEDVSNYALNAGKGLLDKSLQNPLTMPDWWGNDYTYMDADNYASQFPSFVQPSELAQTDIPGEYQGLMGSDYDRLEQSLRTPGDIAATNAYDKGSRDLNAYMGNSGMYGSSVMARQANEGINREYMNTEAANAANAAAQRYGLQQNDLQFGAQYGLQRADLDRQQNLDQWKAHTTNNGLLQDYNNQQFQFNIANAEAARGERNQLAQQKYQHQLQQVNWGNMINEQLMNQALALSGHGAPLAGAQMTYQSQQDALDAADTAAKWNLGMRIAGGFFGMGQDGGYGNSLAHSLFNWSW